MSEDCGVTQRRDSCYMKSCHVVSFLFLNVRSTRSLNEFKLYLLKLHDGIVWSVECVFRCDIFLVRVGVVLCACGCVCYVCLCVFAPFLFFFVFNCMKVDFRF